LVQVQNGTEAVSRARNAIKALTAIQFVRGKKRRKFIVLPVTASSLDPKVMVLEEELVR